MFNRNELAHLVFWPMGEKPMITMFAVATGEEVGAFALQEPVRGSDLAKMLPADFGLSTNDIVAITMSGAVKVATEAEFDTAIVTERNKPSLEERLERMERRERRRELREEQRVENARIERQRQRKAERENQDVLENDEQSVDAAPAEQGGASADDAVAPSATGAGEGTAIEDGDRE